MNRIYPFFLLFCCLTALPGLAQTIPNLPKNDPPIAACGVSDQNIPDSTVKLMGQAHLLLARQNARRASSPRNICRIAVEIDSDTYLAYDKDTSRIYKEVLTNIEATSKIFERDINTQLVVVRIHIWKDTEPDPYRGIRNAFTLLNTFASRWDKEFKGVPYDKACYMFTKAVEGAGGVAYLNGTYSFSPLTSVITLAHEFGHNFNSPHTHSCNWSGGPIDYCAPIEGETCYQGSLERATDGTIMSYCLGLPQFHPLCRAVMTEHAEKNFQKLTKAPEKAPTLPIQIILNQSNYLHWPTLPDAERYEIEVATDAAFGQTILSDSSAVNGFDLPALKPNGIWYVRVRAVNQFGRSSWSGTCQVRIGSGFINPPVLLSPAYDQRMVPHTADGKVSFVVQPVGAATAYEWEVYDESGSSYPSSFTTTQATNTPSINRSGLIYWRVRVWIGSSASSWSSTGRFFRNLSYFIPILPFTNPTPLSFPYSFYSFFRDVTSTDLQVTLATDPVFERIVWQQKFTPIPGRMGGMLKALQPDTQYYFRIQAFRAAKDTDLPSGPLCERVESFRTASQPLAAQWQFFNNETVMGLPPERVSAIVPINDGVWTQLEDGRLFQLDATKLTARPINRTTTRGAIGSVNLYLDPNGANGLWLTNSISVYGGKPFSSARQVGRLTAGSDTLTLRTVIKPNNALFYRFSNGQRLYSDYRSVYIEQADSLAEFYQTNSTNTGINQIVQKQLSIWILQYNGSLQRNELIEINKLTKARQAFSKANTPELGQNLNEIVIDGVGNVWVSQTDPSSFTYSRLARFDGQRWTNYPSTAVPFSSIYSLGADAVGNIYVLGYANNRQSSLLWRFDGQTWRELGQLPYMPYGIGTITVDRQGNIWFSKGDFQLVRFNHCGGIVTPKLAATKTSVEVGESTTLKAEGCSSAIWSWSSAVGSTSDLLQKATNELVVTPTANTTYRVRCYDEGCSGSETALTVAVRPRLSVAKVNKTSFCLNDRLTATLSLTGSVEPTNQYVPVLKSVTQTIRFAPVSTTATELSVPIAATLAAGQYVFYVEATQPVIRSRDSVIVRIVAPPLARPSALKTTIEIGESAMLKAEGCISAVWSWSSAVESKTNQLVQGSNELAVSPTASTSYQVRCYDEGCSGGEAVLNLTVLPRLSVGRLRKATYCAGDTVMMPVAVTGRVEAGNQYQVLLRSVTQSTTLVATAFPSSTVSLTLPATLSPGRYALFAQTTQPVVRSRDSVQINVVALPTAELTTTRQALNGGDSTQVIITLTGTPPWRFTRWDGQPVQTAASPYTGWFRATPQSGFNISISALSDANCAVGTLKNTLALSLILGTEPQPGNAFVISPNPTTGIVTIEARGTETIMSIQVYDPVGRVVQQLTNAKPAQKQTLDLGTLSAGTYLLRLQIASGQWLVWKILKL